MPRLDVEQGQPEWFAARLGRITASHAAGCLRRGYEGPLAAFNAIMGITDRQSNDFMKYGMRNEQEARESYWRFLGMPVIEPGGFWVHPVYPWLGASPDGIMTTLRGGLQLKCPQTRFPVDVPEAHEIQCRIEMACTDLDWWDYYAWWEPDCHFYQRLERDRALEAELIDGLAVFYDTYIAQNREPPRRAKKGEA